MLPPPPRDQAVDLARGVAVLSMLVAHTAPGDGPLRFLFLSEHLTVALFAMLVGVGAQLGRSRRGGGSGVWAGVVVRAGALIVLGWALEQPRHQVLIVLVHLGVLTVVASALAALPARWVAAVGMASWMLVPTLHAALAPIAGTLTPGSLAAQALDLAATGVAYRLTSLLAWACVGVLLARRRAAVGPDALAGGLLLVAGLGLFAAARLDLLRAEPYDPSRVSVLLNGLLAAGTVLACAVLAARLPRETAPVVRTGAMALTLYTLQILAMLVWLRSHPADDSWVFLAGLGVGAVVVPALWRLLPLSGTWRRGPVEGAVGRLAWVVSGRGRATSA